MRLISVSLDRAILCGVSRVVDLPMRSYPEFSGSANPASAPPFSEVCLLAVLKSVRWLMGSHSDLAGASVAKLAWLVRNRRMIGIGLIFNGNR